MQIPDLVFFSLVLFLTGLGLVMVYSASSVTALDHFGDSLYYLKRQSVFVLAGLACMFLIVGTDYHRWVRQSGWILVATLVALVLTQIPGIGHRVGGAKRWIDVVGFRLQPGEFSKIACILYMTWALVRKGKQVKSFTYGLLPMGIVAGIFAGLLLRQPDFGNAVLLVTLSGILLFLAGGRLSYLFAIVLCGIPTVYALIMGAAYRKKRLLSFLNPWNDPQHTSYQIIQSFTAFFHGGAWGMGLGNSQEKLYYLPEVHTDFIGAVIGEELGFLGVAVTVLAFLFLVIRGYRIALRAKDPVGFLLAAGCTTLIGLQAVLNFCVIMGLLPTKGLPLPFISHGGSALLVTFIACGFIQSVARTSPVHGPVSVKPWLEEWGR